MTEDEAATLGRTRFVRRAVWNGPPLLLAADGVRVLVAGTGSHRPESRLPSAPAVSPTVGDLGRCLVERAGLDPACLTVLLDPATPADLSEALDRVAGEATSAVLFHYVGHGLFGPDGELHLATRATVDLGHGVPGYQALPYSVVRDILASSRAGLSLVVLDCCFTPGAPGTPGKALDRALDTTWRGSYLLASSSREGNTWALPGVRHTALTGALVRLLNEGDPAGPPAFALDHVYHRLARTLPATGFPRPRRVVAEPGERPALAVNPAYAVPDTRRRQPGDVSPYPGLAGFGPEQAELFFGRETMTRLLVARVRQSFPGDGALPAGGTVPIRTGGPVVVTGSPGCGKTSLLRAGLIPALRPEPYALLVPGADPLGALATALAPLGDVDQVRLRAIIESDPAGARRALTRRALVVVDQFEEVFTHCAQEEARRRFTAALGELARSAAVVIAVRADFFGRCAAYPGLLEAVRRPEVVVPMTETELRAAIEEPAARSGLAVEPGLTELLLEDLQVGAAALERSGGPLPLLSHALLATWQRRTAGMLTMTGYREAGGVTKALATSAEEALRGLGAESEPVVRELLVRLVDTDAPGGAAVIGVPVAGLIPGPPSVHEQVLAELVRARLVTVAGGVARIAHEALLHAWPRLAGWAGTDRAGLLVRRRLAEDARAWQEQGQPLSILYDDSTLAAARAVAGDAPDDPDREFLRASARRRARRSLIARGTIAGLAVLLLAATAGGVVALRQGRAAGDRAIQAAGQRDQALSRQVAATADSARDTALGAQLALSAYRISATPEARGALLGSLSRPVGARMLGHTSPVERVAYRHDGRVVVTASADSTARLWNVTDPLHPSALGVIHGHAGGLAAAAFSADGRVLATGSADKTARLWDVSDPARPKSLATLKGHTERVVSVAFSPERDLLASASPDGSVRLWDVATAGKPRRRSVLPQDADPTGVAFSPDGRMMAVTSSAGGIALIDVATPARPRSLAVLSSPDGAVRSVAFAPDGRHLATAAATGALHLWDITAARLVGTANGSGTAALDLAFSPDGEVLAGASADATVGLWSVATPSEPERVGTLTGFADSVTGVAFSPDGRHLATSSADGTARLWNVADPARLTPRARLTGHADPVNGLAISRTTLATASDDRTVRLWDVSDPAVARPLSTLTGHTGLVRAAAFSPDGRHLATASLDGTARLWDVAEPASPTQVATLSGHSTGVRSVSYGPDGRLLVTTGRDGRSFLWDVADPGAPVRVATPGPADERFGAAAFRPDGLVLATGSGTSSVRLWDVSKPARPRRLGDLAAVPGDLLDLRFSRDGRTLATGASDGAARLWDVTRPERPMPLAVLAGHSADVTGVAFSADGRMLATASRDSAIRIWDVADRARPALWAVLAGRDVGGDVEFRQDGAVLVSTSGTAAQLWGLNVEQASERACEATGAAITRDEWARYIQGRPYSTPCP
ncbi:hypothetical protein ABGB18_06720 [Nonomuraea sp. B12E4]|uniref:caspase, EACC1-associated type n=1 Tax=Nonomuraea sp. B12E4 TaxID=3153564 RepID=UPI00325CABC7